MGALLTYYEHIFRQQGRKTDRETETYNEIKAAVNHKHTRETQLYSLNSNIIIIIHTIQRSR